LFVDRADSARPNAAARTKRAIILDFLMPNGKTMRECAFGYVRKLGDASLRSGH
jgi:hypothetical protein